jgi:hypothetical protein
MKAIFSDDPNTSQKTREEIFLQTKMLRDENSASSRKRGIQPINKALLSSRFHQEHFHWKKRYDLEE